MIKLDSIQEALEDFRNGKFVVVVDDFRHRVAIDGGNRVDFVFYICARMPCHFNIRFDFFDDKCLLLRKRRCPHADIRRLFAR